MQSIILYFSPLSSLLSPKYPFIYVDIISLYIARVSTLFSKNPLEILKLTHKQTYLNNLPFIFIFIFSRYYSIRREMGRVVR